MRLLEVEPLASLRVGPLTQNLVIRGLELSAPPTHLWSVHAGKVGCIERRWKL